MTRPQNNLQLKIGFSAELKVSGKSIAFEFESVGGSQSLFRANISSQDSLKIKDLIQAIQQDLGEAIPDAVELTLDELLWVLKKEDSAAGNPSSTFLISITLGQKINLSNLPLVGKKLSEEQTIEIDQLKVIYASDTFSQMAAIPELPQRDLQKGLALSTSIKFGEQIETLDIPITQTAAQNSQSKDTSPKSKRSTLSNSKTSAKSKTTSKAAIAKRSAPPSSPTTETIKWFDLKRDFGPVYFKRVGAQYQNSEVWFFLDASLSAAGLTLTLEGLAVGSSIKKFKPQFRLQGLGIDYESKGAVAIGGSFLRSTINGKDDYSGTVIIKTETFTLSAIGSYTTTDEGHPSLFIYGVLDKPLGGPAFFFVTGLALGFAYNRRLLLPTLDQIPNFPLVRAALGGAKATVGELMQIQQDLRPYIPPKTGQIVLAVGIKFTSFKLIESFLLLTVTIGDQFSLDLLGISTLISPPVPPGIEPSQLPPPLAQIRIGILARFVPEEGTLTVDGKILSDSYLFDRACRLSGGFAFYCWFKGQHAGDFVLTVGGYHPGFKVPAHYPKVAPIALNWRISKELNLKGSLYFALTASAIMAGGRLEAVWQSGNIKAWFVANAHFIVAWQPYFYDARISVSVGGSYTFRLKLGFLGSIQKTIKIEVGADLHIWGPEFSGTATIKLHVVSFTVRFGSRSQKKPPPLSWADFKDSFLPAATDVCTVAVESGLLRKLGENSAEVWVVNPKEFVLNTGSVIPIKTEEVGNILADAGDKTRIKTFGIAPMEVNSSGFIESTYGISIKKEGKDMGEHFKCKRITKNIPTGLWGKSNSRDQNKTRFINKVLSGYTIRPANPPKPGKTQEIDRRKLAYDVEQIDDAYQWNSFSTFSTSAETDEDARQETIGRNIISTEVTRNRNSLIQSLGLFAIDVDLEEFETTKGKEQAFVISPQLEATIP